MDRYAPRNVIAAADTTDKVWDLVDSLVNLTNGVSDESIVANVRAWVALAQKASA